MSFVILWFKFMGLIILGNFLLSISVLLFFQIYFRNNRQFNYIKLFDLFCKLFFVVLNTMIYIKLLHMALSTFELEFLNRKYILLMFIPIYSANRLLKMIGYEYSKDYLSNLFDITEGFTYDQIRTFIHNKMISHSLRISFFMTFLLQVFLLFNPAFQGFLLSLLRY
jgi:hypothetical protein